MKTMKEPFLPPIRPGKGDEGQRVFGDVSSFSLRQPDSVLREFAKDLSRKGRPVVFNLGSDFEWPTATGFNPRNVGSYVISYAGPPAGARTVSTSSTRKLATRVRELNTAALAVWNNQSDADEWLSTKLYELGDETPIEACATDKGLEAAKKILLRIAYGAPA